MANNFTEEQIDEFKENFHLFDKNADGWVNLEELGHLVNSLGKTVSDEDLRKQYFKYDENGENGIEFEDFVKILASFSGENDAADSIAEAFKVFDRDGSGLITAEKLLHVMLTFGVTFT